MKFPSNPSPGDTYTEGLLSWVFDGVAWQKTPVSEEQVARAETAAQAAEESANASALSAQAAAESAQAAAESAEDAAGGVLVTALTGLSTASSDAVTEDDNVLEAFGKLQAQVTEHAEDGANPHGVTAAQVGLGNVDNTSDADKPISDATQLALNEKSDTDHTHTKADIGLGNVDNTSDEEKPVSTAQAAAIAEAKTLLEVNSQTGTSYTLVLTDAGKRVARSNSSANTTTVPPNSSVAFPVNTIIFVSQDGTGDSSIAAGSGVTVNAAEGLNIGGQYKMVSLIKTATDTWMLVGGAA